MEMTVRMPANYNLMTEDEMTYTTGGATAAETYVAGYLIGYTIAGAALLVNWLDLLLGARRWMKANDTGDFGDNVEQGLDAWMDYTSGSVVKCIRSIFATLVSVTTPIGWIGTAAAFLTI